jgi:hypothetical protein
MSIHLFPWQSHKQAARLDIPAVGDHIRHGRIPAHPGIITPQNLKKVCQRQHIW